MYPEIRFSETFVLPTYILTISLLYCFLIFFTYRRALKQSQPLSVALDLTLILMVCGFIGGRALHVLYEMPSYYFQDWTRIFRFWEGGFVFYGGFLAALLGCWFYLSRKKLSFLKWADFFAPVLALGYGLGRISCFLAGCCYGRFCSAPWAVRLAWDPQQMPRHPVQLYVVIWELSVFAFLLWLEKKKLRSGEVFLSWLLFHSLGRLMMEFFRDDFRGHFILGLSISTWLSLILFSASLGLLYVRRNAPLRHPL